MTQTCPGCEADNLASNRFCTNCGHTLSSQTSRPTVSEEAPPNARKVCAGCRTANEASAAYCYRCGLKLPGQLYTQSEVVGSPAGFWIRLGAYLIDEVLLVIAGVLLTVTFTGMDLEQAVGELAGESTGWATTLITFGFGAAYYTFTIGQWGRRLAKPSSA